MSLKAILSKFSPLTKFFLIAFILSGLIFSVTRALAADSALKQFVDGKNAGNNLENWLGIDSQAINVAGLLNILVDVDTISPDLVQGKIPQDGRFFTRLPGGVFGATTNAIASLYNAPASGIQYLAGLKDSFLGKPAYAQGVGFQGLQPILPIWRAFRNVIYIFSAVIFIAIGIMIMLRVKISPQAVISIQNAIPQIVTALILVTFSYAIAGLLIDLSYVLLGIVLAILFQSQGKSLTESLFLPSFLSNVPILGAIVNPFSFFHLSSTNIITGGSLLILPSLVTILLGTVVCWLIGLVISLPLVGLGAPVVAGLFGSVGSILVVIILAIALIVWMIKFLFGLFKCYATLLFKIIIGPLEIGFGAIPNSKIGFNSWLLDVIANLSVFPISVLFLVISNLIIAQVIWGGFSGSLNQILQGNITGGGLWTPILLGGDLTSFALRRFGGIAAMAIGVSTLLIVSKLPEMIPQFVFMLKPSPWGKAIGESADSAIGAPVSLIGRATGGYESYNKARQSYYEAERARRTVPSGPSSRPTASASTENQNNPPGSSSNTDTPDI